MAAIDKFFDDFSSGVLASPWNVVAGDDGLIPSIVSGNLTLEITQGGLNWTVFPLGLYPNAWLDVGAGRNFFVQFQVAGVTIINGTNISSAGIGIGNGGTSITPIVEFGGTAAGSPNVYFSPSSDNEIGRKLSVVGLPASSFLVRVARADMLIWAEFSTDSGVTWSAWNTTYAARTGIVRHGSVISTPLSHEGNRLMFFSRQAHPIDSAGISVTIDNVYVTTWDRFSDPVTVGNLRARSWPGGGSIDLSWTNTLAGPDEPRSLAIVRSMMAPPELQPVDLVDDPAPTLGVDMTTPTPQYIPTSISEWGKRYPSVATPTYLWDMTGGGTAFLAVQSVFDKVTFAGQLTSNGPTSLVPCVGINIGAMQLVTAPEFFDQAPPSSPSYESAGGGVVLATGNSNSIAVYIVFRVARLPGTTRTVFSNVNDALTNGYRMALNTSGQLIFQVFTASVASTITLPANYGDGAWHAVAGIIDWSVGTMRAWGDLDGFITGGAITAHGTLSTVFSVGKIAGSATDRSVHMQVLSIAGWERAAALSILEPQARAMFTHGRVPFTAPDTMPITYTRSSIAAGGWPALQIGETCSIEQVAKYATSTSYAPAQFWHGFHPLYEHATRLDGAFDISALNLLTDSEGISDITFTSATSDTVSAGPTGLSSAVRVVQTAVDGRAAFTKTALTGSTVHTFSFYAKSNISGHKATVWIRDAADTTTLVNVKTVVYLQPYYKRYFFTFSTGAGTGVTIRLYGGLDGVDTAGSVSFSCRMIAVGTTQTDYVPSQVGLGATRSPVACYLTATMPGAFVSAAQGEIRTQVRRVQNTIGQLGMVVYLTHVGGAITIDDRQLQITTSEAAQGIIVDSTSVNVANPTSGTLALATAPVEIRLAWSSVAAITGAGTSHARLWLDGVPDDARGAAFTTGPGSDQLFIGALSTSGLTPTRGGIAFVRLYNGNPATAIPTTPFGVGLDPLGKVVYSGLPIGAAGGAGSYQDTDVTPRRFYYYSLFVSRVPLAAVAFTRGLNNWRRLARQPGDTDAGPSAPVQNRVGGIVLEDRVTIDGKYLYAKFPEVYRRADEQDRQSLGRATGLLDDVSTFLQRGVDQTRGYIAGVIDVVDPEVGPLGLIGDPQNQTSIVDAFLRDRSINPDAVGLLGSVRRRLWGGAIDVIKRKGTVAAAVDYVTLLTGWKAVTVTVPGLDFGVRFLQTWDGEASRVIVSQAVNTLTLSTGSITVPSLALPVDKYAGGVYIDYFGNSKLIRSNTATKVVFDDATFTPVAERTFTATVSGGNSVVLPTSVNDSQYTGGKLHETGLGAAVSILGTVSSTRTVTTAPGLTNGASQAVAIAFSYTGNFAARVPTFRAKLYAGTRSGLYEPMFDLSLLGKSGDPFNVIWSGLAPTGSGANYPTTDDDVIVLAPVGAARVANRRVLWMSPSGTAAVIEGDALDARPGDYLNPNRNQGQWFRITSVSSLGSSTAVTVVLDEVLSLSDVAALFDLATIVPRQTLEHDRAVRSMLPAMLPFNSRVFIYYQE